MRWHRAVGLLLVALLAAPEAGCSFLSVRGPPSTLPEGGGPPSGEVRCTDHYGAPIGDAFVGTVVAAISALPIAFLTHGCGGSAEPGGGGGGCDMGAALGVGIAAVALAVTLAASSVYGFVQVGRCNAARRAAEGARARRQAWLPAPAAGRP
ncbi:MAG: hypothetical protein HY906_03835 [Deltaproteobacteria bacterium]|nr:hypothetical protein [Deltaproteobacteria bacterium]